MTPIINEALDLFANDNAVEKRSLLTLLKAQDAYCKALERTVTTLLSGVVESLDVALKEPGGRIVSIPSGNCSKR